MTDVIEEFINNNDITCINSISLSQKDNLFYIEDDIIDPGKMLYINEDWYNNNKSLADKFINYIIRNTKFNKFNVYSSLLISDSLIDSLISNSNINKVSLYYYKLKLIDYKKLKNSNIKEILTDGVEEELKDNFDPLIEYNNRKSLISLYQYSNLISPENMYISNNLSEEEYKYFKYINPDKIIYIEENAIYDINKIYLKLKECELSNKIIIKVKDKNKFNSFALNNDLPNTINIEYNLEVVNISKYLELEKLLYNIVEPAKSLSSFEKYIYAYNIVKMYKKYKENKEDKLSARNLYSILENEYIVCVGFANFFGDLLDKLEIKNIDMNNSVDISYEDINPIDENIPLENKNVEYAGHARRYVYLKDEKYNIDGYYISDPTWDNDLEKDYYNHLILTNDEEFDSSNYLCFYGSKELFDIHSLDEFYIKLDAVLKQSTFNFETKFYIDELINILEHFDSEYIIQLKNKYKFIDDFVWPDDITDLLDDVGNHILKYVNKPVSGETIMEAVKVIYENFYELSGEELEKKLEDTITINNMRQEKCFPKRYKISENGNRELISSTYDKFEINIEDILDGKKI